MISRNNDRRHRLVGLHLVASDSETRPVAAVRAWLTAADFEHEGDDPIFRSVNRHSGVELGRLLDRTAGLEKTYSAHSLHAAPGVPP